MELKTDQNTPEMLQALKETFFLTFVFEHGHWWVNLDGHLFSIEDTNDGVMLETR